MIDTQTETPAISHLRFRKWITLGFAMNVWLCFLLLVPAAFGNRDYPPHLEGAIVEKYKTVGDVSLNLWIFNPKNHKPTDHSAAILFFFGGGWNAGSPAQFKSQCQHLAEHGMVAITVDYRVNSRNNVKPVKCVADVKSSMRWVRANAARLGIDPSALPRGAAPPADTWRPARRLSRSLTNRVKTPRSVPCRTPWCCSIPPWCWHRWTATNLTAMARG